MPLATVPMSPPPPNGPLLLAVFVVVLVLVPPLLDPKVKGPPDVEVASRAGGKEAPLARPKLWLELSPEA